jgi:hypothetical protein
MLDVKGILLVLIDFHFEGKGACYSFRIKTRKVDKQANYSHKLAQTNQ